mmetsp:Transcript_62613/g.116473  ORF Transcript_62613/g.116473 Transcript_62613/m.116473 type:complete len:257 (-) Transcript_62613:143-913(-)
MDAHSRQAVPASIQGEHGGGLLWPSMWVVLCSASVLLDHAVSLAAVVAVMTGAVSSLAWALPACLWLSFTSCLLRMRSHAVSEKLPRCLVEPVLAVHIIQLSTLFLVLMIWQPAKQEERSDAQFLLLMSMASLSVICGDCIVIFAAYARRRDAAAVSKELDASQPPSIERFVCGRGEAGAEEQPADASCAICLSEFNEEELLARLPCRHVFHAACLDRWFANATRTTWCPYRCSCEQAGLPEDLRWASSEVIVREM